MTVEADVSPPKHTGFETEADMLRYLAAASSQLAGARVETVFEVSAAFGIPDLVFLEVDLAAIELRGGVGFVTDAAGVAVMLTLGRLHASEVDELSTLGLSKALGVTKRHLSDNVLPRLEKSGHIVRLSSGNWRTAYPFTSVAKTVVTVEAKIRDWRRGLGQAARQVAGADSTWLALDAKYCERASRSIDIFRNYSVGLASVSTNGEVEIIHRPDRGAQLLLRRELLAERAAKMVISGTPSGPVPQVFGKQLIATTGPDPRLADVGVR